MIELIIFLPIYAASALTILETEVEPITEKTATLTWKTDELSSGSLAYSKNQDLSDAQTKQSNDISLEHSFDLDGLDVAAIYYYMITAYQGVGEPIT